MAYPVADSNVRSRPTRGDDQLSPMVMHEHHCGLCNAREATKRTGRLGRYAITCDACEQRRGSHLKRNGSGYMNRTPVTPVRPYQSRTSA